MGHVDSQRSRLVPLERGRIFLCERGSISGDSTPPLVLVHGLAVTGHSFRHVLMRLGDRRLLIPDLLGSGSSDRPSPREPDDYGWTFAGRTLGELVWHLGVDRVDVVGHGIGALAAASLARQSPHRVRRLILVGAPCQGWRPPRLVRVAATRWGTALLPAVLGRGSLERYLGDVRSTPELADPHDLAVYWSHLIRRGGRSALVATLRHLSDRGRIAVAYDGLRADVSLVWGDRDRIVAPELGQALADRIGAGRFHVIEGCGHAPHEERPIAFAEVVRSILDA